MLKHRIKSAIPPKPYLVLGNRMFLLSMGILIISAYFYDANEAFIAVEVGIIHFLYNLKFSNIKTTIKGSIEPLLMTLIAVPLSLVPMPFAPITTALFVFMLVLIERDNHHQGVPKYILPLSSLLLSMMMTSNGMEQTELMMQRSVSVVLGVTIAVIANTLIWPRCGANEDNKPRQLKRRITSVDLKYSSRTALGIGLILSLEFFGWSGAALGAYLLMMIHNPISRNLAPKAWERLSGTVIGALLYVPAGTLLSYVSMPALQTVLMWSLVILSLYVILIYLEHNYTVASASIMFLILTIAVGPFNLDIVELVFLPRLWYTLIGGGVMVALGLAIPLQEKDMQI